MSGEQIDVPWCGRYSIKSHSKRWEGGWVRRASHPSTHPHAETSTIAGVDCDGLFRVCVCASDIPTRWSKMGKEVHNQIGVVRAILEFARGGWGTSVLLPFLEPNVCCR